MDSKIPLLEIDWHEHEKNAAKMQELKAKKSPPKPSGGGCLPFLLVPVIALLAALFCLDVKAQSSQRVLPSDHADYLGVSIGTLGEQYVRYEHDVTDKYVLLQASAYAGLNGYGVQYKLGAGYAPAKSKVRAYIFLPYMNMSFKDFGYNTPFAAEVFYDLKKIHLSAHFDIYPLGTLIVPSARVRWRLAKYRF